MAGETEKDLADIAEKPDLAIVDEKPKEVSTKKKEKGLISRIWNGLFGSRNEDLERRLERLSKEEAVVLSRTRKRSLSCGRIKRNIVLFSILFEVIAIVYALMTARSVEDWKKRAFHVLPMFILPALSSITYIGIVNFMKMGERKDQKTLERLRAERQSKIDELKEKTNYYITQQLIQRYDTDPAAKAAAASVLASKLGAESGLKVYIGDDSKLHATTGEGNDVELLQSDGLRNRKQPQDRRRSVGTSPALPDPGSFLLQQIEAEIAEQNQPAFVDHYQQAQGSDAYSGGWLARLAAIIVGEDPTQCYALICGNCHMHNGLASKEDFPFVTYICPHCQVMNGPRKKDDRLSDSSTPTNISSPIVDNVKEASSTDQSPREETPEIGSNEQTVPSPLTEEASDEAVTSKDKES